MTKDLASHWHCLQGLIHSWLYRNTTLHSRISNSCRMRICHKLWGKLFKIQTIDDAHRVKSVYMFTYTTYYILQSFSNIVNHFNSSIKQIRLAKVLKRYNCLVKFITIECTLQSVEYHSVYFKKNFIVPLCLTLQTLVDLVWIKCDIRGLKYFYSK